MRSSVCSPNDRKQKELAVGGMPTGSPGMEVPGTPPDTYDVILFSSDSQRVFARYRGAQVI